ncbi:MAG: TolC family protein [Burkholderiaceae bacterium]
MTKASVRDCRVARSRRAIGNAGRSALGLLTVLIVGSSHPDAQAQTPSPRQAQAQSPADTQTQPLSLRKIVRYAIDNYPSVIAAQADRQIASFNINRARGKHYPVVDVAGAQRLRGDSTNQFGPRIRMNVWASGAIEAEIERETWREQSLASVSLQTREEVAFDVVTAYLDLLGAIGQEKVARQNLERHQALVEDFREIARIDKGRRFDLVQSLARMSQVQFSLAQRQSDIIRGREVLSRFYPFPFDPARLREPAALSEPVGLSNARLQAVIDQHPSVLAAANRLRAAEANIKMAKGERGPRVDVETRTGADSFSQLTFSWPAFDLAAGATEDAAVAGLSSAKASLDEQQRLVAEEQKIAWENYKSARERETIASGQVDIAKQLVTVYREQFGIGRRNLLDLLNAYAELANAESSTHGSRIEALLARHQMEYSAGRLSLLFVERTR